MANACWFHLTLFCTALAVAAGAHAQRVENVVEAGIDQQVLLPLVGVDRGAPLFVAQRFLEARKAKALGVVSTMETLELRAVNRRPQRLLDTERGDPLWVGPLGDSAGAAVFAVRAGRGALAAFRVDSQGASSPHALPWQASGLAERAPDYERAFFVPGGVLAVRSDFGARVLEFWADGAAQPARLEWNVRNGDGRITAVPDVVVADGRVLVLLTVQAAGHSSMSELWLASVNAKRLTGPVGLGRFETGPLAAGEFSFVRTADGPTGVRVLARRTVTSQPVLQLYPLNELSPVWSDRLDRLESGRDTAVTGVCGRSFVVVRRTGSGRDTELLLTLVGPSGKAHALDGSRPATGETLVGVELQSIGDKVYLFTNYSQLESSRRADGWYSWRGYRVDRLDAAEWCTS